MAVQVSYPGVYIEEFTPGAPIEGVGTSTAAFVGVAAKGDIDRPTKLTTWDQFRDRFGEQPVPGFYPGTRPAASSRTGARSATSSAPATGRT
jgi:phage tail sheath protein FI